MMSVQITQIQFNSGTRSRQGRANSLKSLMSIENAKKIHGQTQIIRMLTHAQYEDFAVQDMRYILGKPN